VRRHTVNVESIGSTGVELKVVRLFGMGLFSGRLQMITQPAWVRSSSAAFPGLFLAIFGAPGTAGATSPACGAPGPGLVAASGAFAGGSGAQGESGPGNQTGNAKTCQNLFQVINFHVGLLLIRVDIRPFPGAENRQTKPRPTGAAQRVLLCRGSNV